MATVRPFRGIAFDPTRAPDLASVTCPPYDVISPAEREALYQRHPYNVVRIVSGRVGVLPLVAVGGGPEAGPASRAVRLPPGVHRPVGALPARVGAHGDDLAR